MNDIIKVKLILLVFAFFIAYQFARIGRKRQIGFYWSLFFGLLYPLVAAIMVFTSKKIGTPVKRTPVIVKILGVFLIVIGVFYFISNVSTNNYFNSLQTETVQPAQTEFNFLDESSQGIGRIIGGGVLTIFVSSESYSVMDYKAKRNIGNIVSFIMISVGIYLLRKKKKQAIKTEVKSTE